MSLPERGEVAAISLETYRVTHRIAVLGQPRGMSLSLDATQLFVALDEANQVGVINLSDLSVSTIGLGSAPNAAHTFDVVEAATDRLVVTTGDGNQFSYVVQVRRDQANAVSRIASDRIIRVFPVIVADADHRFAYVGERFSPNSLYKIVARQPVLRQNGRRHNSQGYLVAHGVHWRA